MDSTEFRKRAQELVEYIIRYQETLETRRVTPNVQPGYLKSLIPSQAPEFPDNWENVMKDLDDKIMIGMTHWQHPRFHAYFPAGNSYPSMLADFLSAAIGCIGFSWASAPSCTELEIVVLDWLGQMMGLPEDFLFLSPNSRGGGVIQTSASECILVSILAARFHIIKRLREEYPGEEDEALLAKLIAYSSKEAHSCMEKGCMIAFVKVRGLEADDDFSLRGDTLLEAIQEDIKKGFVPFFVSCTVGTTSCASADNIKEIGPICEEYGIWLHVDSAYAGSAMICQEFRHLFEGIEYASSVNTNGNKWLLTNFDCACYWVKDRFKLNEALTVDPLYLKHSNDQKSIDYRHWGIPLSRRFRSLKLWFVIRMYGVEGLRKYIREHCRLAKVFEKLVRQDPRFEVVNKVMMGLVCFRLRGSNEINEMLLKVINASGRLHMVPSLLKAKYTIRFCVCRENATDDDMRYAWNVIRDFAEVLIILRQDVESFPDAPEDPVDSANTHEIKKEAADLYKSLTSYDAKGQAVRRHSLALSTSTVTDVIGRTNLDQLVKEHLDHRKFHRDTITPTTSINESLHLPVTRRHHDIVYDRRRDREFEAHPERRRFRKDPEDFLIEPLPPESLLQIKQMGIGVGIGIGVCVLFKMLRFFP
ncbi:unnamed protein product [Allacma fusca]|uniref:Tyrosine decarboxylase n=1 Tax=Allacma fusca TaxID=39272 RepID=A0A8J2KVF6_9HEXA|nr:unnamed protein product [Allacma fusca]